ncbi:ribonuclease III [Alkaliphilus serpentinus]|uniref:Ribonuclease 3 n=1 Tax=Alkaliphilus serpentinus TaxID=1482731 RepID=A0A833HQU4_9FIRM|nr:ribonuclease III [Alkaliphilus serpentinus]KAB3531416.1 ribonuclease III [Alkaliphilus serpentinus]
MIHKNRRMQLEEFQRKILYSFQNLQLLNTALTHSSYANEMKNKNVIHNERLEFLGDSILSLAISDYIFHQYKHLPEGDLTKVRANVVCEPSLAIKAKNLMVGDYMLLGKGEENTGGRQRGSILADAFEAIIGALYIDGGFQAAREFVLSNLSDLVELAVQGNLFKDFKTQLQEILQSKTNGKISYQVVNEEGPDHAKIFSVEVYLDHQLLGRGRGKSKKEAEQNAAEEAIEKEIHKYE